MTLKLGVGKKGYLIIPKSIREAVGIKEGDEVEVIVENNRIVLVPIREVNFSVIEKKLEEHWKKVNVKARLGELRAVSLEEEFDG